MGIVPAISGRQDIVPRDKLQPGNAPPKRKNAFHVNTKLGSAILPKITSNGNFGMGTFDEALSDQVHAENASWAPAVGCRS